jgi:hypothetical protein
MNGNYKNEHFVIWKVHPHLYCCIVHVSYHCVGWVIIYFQGVRGLVELCAIGWHPRVCTCSWVDILKTYTYTPQWESQGERLWVVSHVLIAIMNLGVVIDVGNGQTWDKPTHYCEGLIWLLTCLDIVIKILSEPTL